MIGQISNTHGLLPSDELPYIKNAKINEFMKKNHNKIYAIIFVFAYLILFNNYFVIGQNDISDDNNVPYSKETHTYKVVDNHQVLADIYKFDDNVIRPVIIWIHPGALIMGSRKKLPPGHVEKYIKAGYVFVSIDYRLAPESSLPAIIEDLEDAYSWVTTQGPELFSADPNRVVVIGHSAGGYLTLMTGFRVQPPPKALVSFYGYGDITEKWLTQPSSHYNKMPAITRDEAIKYIEETVISTHPPGPSWPDGRGKFYIYCRQQGIWPEEVSGHDPENESDWFKDYEPVRNVSKSYPPTLLLHGEIDSDVPFEKSMAMIEVFKHYDIEYEFITKPTWDHMFDYNVENISTIDQVINFLDKYVK